MEIPAGIDNVMTTLRMTGEGNAGKHNNWDSYIARHVDQSYENLVRDESNILHSITYKSCWSSPWEFTKIKFPLIEKRDTISPLVLSMVQKKYNYQETVCLFGKMTWRSGHHARNSRTWKNIKRWKASLHSTSWDRTELGLRFLFYIDIIEYARHLVRPNRGETYINRFYIWVVEGVFWKWSTSASKDQKVYFCSVFWPVKLVKSW